MLHCLKRPMERIAKPLREMGAQIQTTGERRYTTSFDFPEVKS